MMRALVLFLLLAATAVQAQTPSWEMQVAELDARLAAVDAAAGGNGEAALERLEARQAVAALPKTRTRERAEAYEIAEALVRRAEFALKSAELEAQLLALDRERDGILLEASRRDAELARKEAERMRLLALAREEEEAMAVAVAVEQAAVQDAQARELADAEAKDAELARLEEELAAQAAAKGDVLASRTVAGKPAYRLSASAFEPGKAVLTADAKRQLQQLARKLKAGGKAWSIEGHTDSLGNEDGNLALSRQRAEAVQAVFRAAGIPAGRLGVKGWGSAKPLAANTGKNGRAQNRRIEILPK